jgi:hypothetical protein
MVMVIELVGEGGFIPPVADTAFSDEKARRPGAAFSSRFEEETWSRSA